MFNSSQYTLFRVRYREGSELIYPETSQT